MSFDRKNAVVATVIGVLSLALALFAYIKPPPSPAGEAPSTHSALAGSSAPSGTAPPQQLEPARQNPEDSLKWLSTGITRLSLQERFGSPRFEKGDQILSTTNLVFVFPRFFLQTILGQDGTVLLYSVTTRSPDFRPAIPKVGGRLLETKFAQFGGPGPFSANMSSKFYEYREHIEPVNATNFKTIHLGYCPAGVLLPGQTIVMDTDVKADPQALTRFREQNAPNCFAVEDAAFRDDQLLQLHSLGLDYFLSRDLAD